MKTIFLEFRHENGAIAANGTDTTFGIDGRWKPSTAHERIHDRVAELRRGPFGPKYRGQKFIGFTHAGINAGTEHVFEMEDRDPPPWAQRATDPQGREWRWQQYVGIGEGGSDVWMAVTDEEDVCWQADDLPKTVWGLRTAAMMFEAAYGEPA